MESTDPQCFDVGGFCLDRRRRRLTDARGESVDLPGKAFDALSFLVDRPGVVVSREQLMSALWPESVVEENTLTRAIALIRHSLGVDFIVTVKGRGYQLVAKVRPLVGSEPEPRGRRPNRLATRYTAVALLGALIAIGVGILIVSPPGQPDPMLRYASSEMPTANPRALQLYQSARNYEWNHPDQPEIAIEQYERAVAEDSQFALAWARLSIAHIEEYNFRRDRSDARRQGALDAATRALNLDPDLPDARMALGWYHYVGERDYEAALRELSIAESLMPADSEVHWRLGAVYRRQGSWNDALAEYERAVDLQPEDVWWRIVLAETYTHLREYGQAERQLEIVLDLVPDEIQSLFWEIQIPLFRDGDVGGLVAGAGNPALDVRMAWSVPRPLLGYTAAIYRRDYDTAIAWLDAWSDREWSETRYIARDAAYAIAHELAGREAQARRHFELALAQIEERIALDDDNPALFMALGESLAGLGRYAEANRAARESIAIYLKDRDAMDLPEQRLDAALRVFIRTGEIEAALDELDEYFSVPAVWSIEGVLPDPRLDPIRDHPRLVALREEYGRP